MADSNQLRKLVAYNQWANDKILTAIDGMMAEELARPVDAYFGTIAGNLHHVLWATRIWLARWKGETPPGRTDPIKGSWREAYAETHADFRAFVEPLTDASADRVVAYKDTKGNPYEMVLAQLSRTWSTTGRTTARRRGCCSSGSAARPATWTTCTTVSGDSSPAPLLL